MELSELAADLSNADQAVVCRALAELRKHELDDATLEAIAALFRDARVDCEDHAWGPTYRAVCEEAIATVVATGTRALPILERARAIDHTVRVPEPCYDQGIYMGDYATRTVVVADVALAGIRKVGDKHRGAVAWVGMTRATWETADDVVTMLRAAFEQTSAHQPEHVRRFLVACARDLRVTDADLDAAMSLAEHIAFAPVAYDEMTAARAAARAVPSIAGRVTELALAPELRLEGALEATALLAGNATPDRLRAVVPFQTTEMMKPPPDAKRPGSWTPLLDAVRANLDDDAPRLAFARWLTERGDPRGEFIAVQCELARTPRPPPDVARFDALRKSERELQSAHARTWTRWPNVMFERGFAESVFSTTSFGDSTLAALRDEPTLRELKIMGMIGAAWVDALAASSGAQRLHTLRFSDSRFYGFELRSLFESPYFDNLRELELSNCNLDMKLVRELAAWRGMKSVERLDLTRNKLPPEETRRAFSRCKALRDILL